MKAAKYWEPFSGKKAEKNTIQCHVCPHNCIIPDKGRGICRVRQNIGGKLFSLVYGKPISTHIDPIEKKPLFHFMPGTDSFSLGTVGCNMRCAHCQNWEISQAKPEDFPVPEILPDKIVEMALEAKCPSISYTYTEPSIFYEYVLDCAILAREDGLKNIMVTNGYVNKEPLFELYQYIDAANVDLKGFDEDFYVKQCGAKLKPILETLKNLKKTDTWIEITNLIIPTKNDDMKKIKEMCEWIVSELRYDVPLHFSRFFPMYKNLDLPPTPEETLLEARKIAFKAGLKYVYIGNLITEDGENTHCPKCKKLLVGRSGFGVISNSIRDSKCIYCKQKISGFWS